MRPHLLVAVLVAACLAGCSQEGEYTLSVSIAVDVSGTYTDQLEEVTKVVRTGILPVLLPGDSLVVVTIDSKSYEQDNVVARLTLDHRPSTANAQKLAFAEQLEGLAEITEGSEYTDIPGAMMLCADHLRGTSSGTRVILVFSDLQEDPPPGTIQRIPEDEFTGVHVVAMNVKQLRDDSTNPEVYRRRLADWQQRVLAAGAVEWRVIVDPTSLPGCLEEIRR